MITPEFTAPDIDGRDRSGAAPFPADTTRRKKNAAVERVA